MSKAVDKDVKPHLKQTKWTCGRHQEYALCIFQAPLQSDGDIWSTDITITYEFSITRKDTFRKKKKTNTV